MLNTDCLINSELQGIQPFSKGKVRDIYDLGDRLLIVTSDRISAFDSVLPNGIPHKGKVLNQLSLYWFSQLTDVCRNHLITAEINDMPRNIQELGNILAGRSMLTHKVKMFPIECVVRGYLAGSAWKEYKESGTVCGISLSPGLKESDKLPEPIFTPSTKAVTGHDENISFDKMTEIVSRSISEKLRDISIQLYTTACQKALSKGIIISDTKFEFGWFDNDIILADEVLTPDSSRFWLSSSYKPGESQASFDKQFVRDYLESVKWDKKPPAPELPNDIVQKTAQKYLDAYRMITGKDLTV